MIYRRLKLLSIYYVLYYIISCIYMLIISLIDYYMPDSYNNVRW